MAGQAGDSHGSGRTNDGGRRRRGGRWRRQQYRASVHAQHLPNCTGQVEPPAGDGGIDKAAPWAPNKQGTNRAGRSVGWSGTPATQGATLAHAPCPPAYSSQPSKAFTVHGAKGRDSWHIVCRGAGRRLLGWGTVAAPASSSSSHVHGMPPGRGNALNPSPPGGRCWPGPPHLWLETISGSTLLMMAARTSVQSADGFTAQRRATVPETAGQAMLVPLHSSGRPKHIGRAGGAESAVEGGARHTPQPQAAHQRPCGSGVRQSAHTHQCMPSPTLSFLTSQ